MSERQWRILSLLERLGRGEVTAEKRQQHWAVRAARPADAEAVCQQRRGRAGCRTDLSRN